MLGALIDGMRHGSLIFYIGNVE